MPREWSRCRELKRTILNQVYAVRLATYLVDYFATLDNLELHEEKQSFERRLLHVLQYGETLQEVDSPKKVSLDCFLKYSIVDLLRQGHHDCVFNAESGCLAWLGVYKSKFTETFANVGSLDCLE